MHTPLPFDRAAALENLTDIIGYFADRADITDAGGPNQAMECQLEPEDLREYLQRDWRLPVTPCGYY
jgi:hypothetical protein